MAIKAQIELSHSLRALAQSMANAGHVSSHLLTAANTIDDLIASHDRKEQEVMGLEEALKMSEDKIKKLSEEKGDG
jgi:exonuclease VII small subunit